MSHKNRVIASIISIWATAPVTKLIQLFHPIAFIVYKEFKILNRKQENSQVYAIKHYDRSFGLQYKANQYKKESNIERNTLPYPNAGGQ